MKRIHLETLAFAVVLAGCTAEQTRQGSRQTELKDSSVYIGWLRLDQWDEFKERLEGVAVVRPESLVKAAGLPPTSWTLGDHGWLTEQGLLQSIRAAIGRGVHRDGHVGYLSPPVIAFQFQGRGRYLVPIAVDVDTRRSLLMHGETGAVELDSQLVDLLCNAYGLSAFPD